MVEVASLIGDVAESPQGKPALHIHIVLGTATAVPWPGTRRSPCAADAGSDRHGKPGALRKAKDAETGLALIRPAAERRQRLGSSRLAQRVLELPLS